MGMEHGRNARRQNDTPIGPVYSVPVTEFGGEIGCYAAKSRLVLDGTQRARTTASQRWHGNGEARNRPTPASGRMDANMVAEA